MCSEEDGLCPHSMIIVMDSIVDMVGRIGMPFNKQTILCVIMTMIFIRTPKIMRKWLKP